MIQILAWAGLIQSLQTLSGEVLLALNRSGTLLRFTMFWFAVTLGAVALGLQWGLTGLAVCYTVAITLVEPVRTYLAARAVGISVWRFFGALVGVAQATIAMAVIVFATRQALLAAGVPAAARLVLLILLGVAVYVPLCAWRAPEVVAEVRRVRRRREKTPLHLEPLAGQAQLSKNSFQNEALCRRATLGGAMRRPRSRHSAAMSAPCVLASHRPSRPVDEPSF